MTILFISDLHLDANRPDLTQLFLMFLKTQAVAAEHLYILGDFFEIWIGDDEQTELHIQVAQALRNLAATGVNIYLMHGNRDFLIGQRFCQTANVKLLSDPCIIDLYGTPTLLMHGDSLCTADKAYLKFRQRVRQTWLQKLFLLLPLALRKKIATKMRANSMQHLQHLTPEWMDVTPSEVLLQMQQHQVSRLIHGHTHHPSLHYFFQAQWYQHIVLSDWETEANALICYPDGRLRLEYFK